MCLWGWGGIGVGLGVGGRSSGNTVHVNNQPMIVLLVPFRKKEDCIRGWVGLGGGERGKAFLHTCFSCSLSRIS